MPETRLNIRVSKDFLRHLDEYCRATDLNRTVVTKLAINEYISRHKPEGEDKNAF